ncbi:unnamed protein product, partial [Coregonus sp. 'balchen']
VNLQYCVRWGSSMGPSRLSRSASNKASEAWAPSDPAAQPGMRSSGRQGKGEGAGPGWDSSDSSIVISDEATDHDLIDHYHGNRSVSGCGSSPLELSVSQGKAVIGGKVTGQTERGVESDAESCCSVDSIASGPSFMVQATPLTPPPGLCLTCQRLHREAKRRGHTPLDTLTDDDPTSLSCDQWVLMKKWTPRRPQNVKGGLNRSGLHSSGLHSSGLHSSGPDGEVSPSSVTMETLAQEEATPPQEEEPRKRSGGFRTLLAQLHGNRSRVVRETHT